MKTPPGERFAIRQAAYRQRLRPIDQKKFRMRMTSQPLASPRGAGHLVARLAVTGQAQA